VQGRRCQLPSRGHCLGVGDEDDSRLGELVTRGRQRTTVEAGDEDDRSQGAGARRPSQIGTGGLVAGG
jgi:hypothetical protein